MSQENVEVIRRAYEHFLATGELLEETIHPDLVWDMSTFRGWPERQIYEGIEGTMEFVRDWTDAWEDWTIKLEELHEAGDKVVAIAYQRGRSKTTGLPVEMHFAQLWTLRDGKQVRMNMYADPEEALAAAGLAERDRGSPAES